MILSSAIQTFFVSVPLQQDLHPWGTDTTIVTSWGTYPFTTAERKVHKKVRGDAFSLTSRIYLQLRIVCPFFTLVAIS